MAPGPVGSTRDYNAEANWNPPTAGGATGTATFGVTSPIGTNISFSESSTSVGGFTFVPGAPAYVFTVPSSLTFTGAGIAGNPTFNFNALGNLFFAGSNTTAGSATINNPLVGGFVVGRIGFLNTSTAGNATINNDGILQFFENSTAGNATINNTARSGSINTFGFFNNSTAGNATINNTGTGQVFFFNDSTGARHKSTTTPTPLSSVSVVTPRPRALPFAMPAS